MGRHRTLRRMTDEDEGDRRARNWAALQATWAAVARGDADGMMDQATDDVVMELPFTSPPTRLEGKDAARAYLAQAFAAFRIELGLTAAYECRDPDTVVVEFTSTGRILTNGREYANTVIAVYFFRDGRVCGWREFPNPVPVMEALRS
jgi:ketosteroid isomerase-like protein